MTRRPARRAASPFSRGGPASRTTTAPTATPARRVLFFVVGLVATIVMLAAVTGERGYRDVRRQKARLSRLRAEVASLHRENARLLEDVRRLRSDPYAIEQIAREKLGYARPGEIVFQFPPEHPPVVEAAPPEPEAD